MKNLNFKTAFSYPFNRAKGMLNILWVLLPIIGWFALSGYGIRIIKEYTKGRFKKLPKFQFKSDLKLGFWMFLKAIPFVVAYIIIIEGLGYFHEGLSGFVDFFLEIFLVPILTINFFVKETVGSYFEFKALKPVFNNLKDYIVAILKTILITLIFIVMSIVLIGIPALVFTQNIFLADFYRRRVK
jgi:hypothetical protein